MSEEKAMPLLAAARKQPYDRHDNQEGLVRHGKQVLLMQNDRADSKADNLFPRGALEKWAENFPAFVEINVSDKGLIYREGDRCTKVFCVINGCVKLSVMTAEGNELTTALLRRGQIFGSLRPESSQEAEETAQAVGEVRAYQISRDEFKALLFQHPHLSWWCIEVLCAKRHQAERKLHNILTQTVEMRVLGTLKDLSEAFGVRCVHGYALEVRLTQQDLADLVGASRSVVSTIMNELRRRGMLDYTRDLICINDRALSESSHSEIKL
ncbi:MAG: Crp/Fnr family transcriptional regulator [Gammaproteobacteria bacterium]